MSRPLPPRDPSTVRRLALPVRLPQPGTLTAGELIELSKKTGRDPVELHAAHILAGVSEPPVPHPLRRQRGDTMRQLTAFTDAPPPPRVNWFQLGRF